MVGPRQVVAGSADVSVIIHIVDAADGTPETGVTSATSGIDLRYRRDGAATVALTESDLAALTDAHSDGGLLHIFGGYYRLDIPDAAFAVGVDKVQIVGTITGMKVYGPTIELTDPINNLFQSVAIDASGHTATTRRVSAFGGFASDELVGELMWYQDASADQWIPCVCTAFDTTNNDLTLVRKDTGGNLPTAEASVDRLSRSGIIDPQTAAAAAISAASLPTAPQIQAELEEDGASVLDTLQDRLTAQRATNLDELGAANVPADIDSLLGRLTAARAGYLDNLNVGGAVASQADITAINQSASRRVLLATVGQYERPEAGSTVYTVEARTFDGDGAPVNADSTPTLAATGQTTGDLSGNLGAATNPATGVYRWTYTVASGATIEPVRFDLSATISAATFTLSVYTQVADFVAATFTTADRTKLDTLHDTRLTAQRATNLDELGAANVPADIDTLLARATEARLAELDAANLPADVDTLLSRIVGTLATGTHNPQSGDAYARLGAPAGASVSADIAALDVLLDSIIAEVVTAQGEPGQGAPPVSASLADKVAYLYKAWRNKSDQTATTHRLYADDGATVDQKRTISDDGTTFNSGEVVTGP